MTAWTATFERIGRRHSPPALELNLDEGSPHAGDDAAEAIYGHARLYLGSRWPEVVVTLDLDAGTGTVRINGGRSGRGELTRAAS